MVHENHRWAGARWCTKTAVGQVRDGHRGMGAQWCMKTTVGRRAKVYKNHRRMGPRWCLRTTAGRVHDGVKKLLGDGWAMVREIVGWVGDGVRKPPFGVCAMVCYDITPC